MTGSLANGQRLPRAGDVLVARRGQLENVDVATLTVDDYVAQRYGEGFPSTCVPLDGLRPRKPYGSQLTVRLPHVLDTELALLLGLYASEGHTSHSNYSVVITNSETPVLERCVELWDSCFGLKARLARPADRCPSVIVSSKTVVEFLTALGCGSRASNKQIPWAVMGSPQDVVLAFLQGLACDAFTSTTGTNALWGICLDSAVLLADLQLVLRWLGVRSSLQQKWNVVYRKHYGQVTLSGTQAQHLLQLVSFMEPSKQASADRLLAKTLDRRHDGADLVPLVHGRELYALMPRGVSRRDGKGTGIAKQWRHLVDKRTQWPSFGTVQALRAAGFALPESHDRVLDEGLHFSRVAA